MAKARATRGLSGLLLGALASSAFACEASTLPRTEIMLVVDSDLAVPMELDEIEMRIVGPTGEERVAVAALGESPLPRSLGLVHTEGPLAPLDILVAGLAQGNPVVLRRASLSFVEGRTLVLPMHLVRSCVTASCGEQTCTEEGCRDVAVDAASLRAWDGREPTLQSDPENGSTQDASGSMDDAGTMHDAEGPEEDSGSSEEDAGDLDDAALEQPQDAGVSDGGEDAQVEPTADAATDAGVDDAATDAAMCQFKTEQCNGRDDDCDGVVDNGFNFMTDTQNCGRCGNVCGGNSRICCRGTCSRICF